MACACPRHGPSFRVLGASSIVYKHLNALMSRRPADLLMQLAPQAEGCLWSLQLTQPLMYRKTDIDTYSEISWSAIWTWTYSLEDFTHDIWIWDICNIWLCPPCEPESCHASGMFGSCLKGFAVADVPHLRSLVPR